MSKENEIFNTLLVFTKFFPNEVGDERLDAYAKKLMRFDILDIRDALDLIAEESKFFPSLSEIMEKLGHKRTFDKLDANELSSLIISCLSEFGAYRVEDVKRKVGKVGWNVIERAGGWTSLCRVTYDELGTTRAQLRDISASVLRAYVRSESDIALEYQKKSLRKNENKLELLKFD